LRRSSLSSLVRVLPVPTKLREKPYFMTILILSEFGMVNALCSVRVLLRSGSQKDSGGLSSFDAPPAGQAGNNPGGFKED
jgi:hypothetical protein